jgi:thymidylate kinase
MSRGVVITMSGIDSAGKSTQIDLLTQHLSARGLRHAVFWSRVGYTGGFSWGKALLRRAGGSRVPAQGDVRSRDLLLRRGWVRRIWLTFALLDLLRFYALRIRYERNRSRVVVCDRYLWDSLVDLRVNFGDDVERSLLWRLVTWTAPKPELAIFIDLPIEESISRSDIKGEPYRDSSEKLTRRAEHYRELMDRAGWTVVDGRQPVDNVSSTVLTLAHEACEDI